ncbi:uncharacterized protein [Argopecten irradians]|uniref:uncharacterized protein n=1 Tax=Argopecten irradians TaxID=31199 RepID=UPI00371CED97
MAAMLVIVLVLCLCKGLEGAIPQQRDQQQWTGFQTAINQRLATIERQLTEKDVQIRKLETKLETHIAIYSKYVTDNEREGQRKNIEINQLKDLVTSLKNNVTVLEQTCRVPDAANRMSNLGYGNVANEHVKEENHVTNTLLSVTSSGETEDHVLMSDSSNKDGHIHDGPTTTYSDSTHITSEDDVVPSHRISQIRAVPYSSVVAFHSELTHRPILRSGNTIVFNHETLDEGHGYNPGDGIYIVPETGTYVFVWVTFSGFHEHIQTQLMVNGGVRGSSFSDAQQIHDLHQATSVVVLRVNQGDHMYIKVGHTSAANATLYYDPHYNGASTFSGWKLS